MLDDVAESYFNRDIVNGGFHLGLQRQLKEVYADRFDYPEGANVYLSAKPAAGTTDKGMMHDLFGRIQRAWSDQTLHYLATFFFPGVSLKIIESGLRLNRSALSGA